MGLLKSALKGAVNSAVSSGINKVGNSVSSGIAKGVGNAVSSAVEKKVAPAADKLAGQAAEKINETTATLNTAAAEAGGSMAEAAAGVSEANQAAAQASAAAGAGAGFAGLAGSLSGLMGMANAMATEAASNIKICPKCGEGAPANMKFCPKCGTALPEQTVGEQYICPKCGAKNLPGTSFCAECGAILPIAEKEQAEQKAKDDAVLASFAELLPQYPLWNQGGSAYEITPCGENEGYPSYSFSAEGVTREALDAYIALLKENGFARPEGCSDDESLYKVIDGVSRAFNQTDALDSDRMHIYFQVRTYRKAEKKEEAADAAKKILGKLFR